MVLLNVSKPPVIPLTTTMEEPKDFLDKGREIVYVVISF
jgi:hypothetical protein